MFSRFLFLNDKLMKVYLYIPISEECILCKYASVLMNLCVLHYCYILYGESKNFALKISKILGWTDDYAN